MKQKAYRQNPTVIDLSKKARPPPGETMLIYELSNHLDTAYNAYAPVRAFRTGAFCTFKKFLKKFQKIFGVFEKRRIAPRKGGKHHQLSNEKGGENVEPNSRESRLLFDTERANQCNVPRFPA